MRIGLTLQSLDPTWGVLYPGFGAGRKLLGRYQRKLALQDRQVWLESGWLAGRVRRVPRSWRFCDAG
jgi:hypothetical protein